MLELLNGGGGGGLFFPNSGPGSKYLEYGSKQLGFFGIVSSEELFSTAQLRDELDLWTGVSLADTGEWLKYMYQERVCFTPRKELMHSISWNTLYDAGVVYGTDDLGTFPNGDGVNQMQVVTKGTDFFKVRLFNIAPVDPTASVGGVYPTSMRESEWFQLIPALLNDAVAGYTGPQWSLFSNTELTYGAAAWAKETRETYNNYALTMGSDLVSSTTATKLTASTNYAWRPVLELVDGNLILLRPADIQTGTVGLTPLAILDLDYTTGVFYPALSVQDQLYGPTPAIIDSVDLSNYLSVPRTLAVDTLLEPLVLSEYTIGAV